jgi:polyhydroxyalkanoate synthase subunit PhaC
MAAKSGMKTARTAKASRSSRTAAVAPKSKAAVKVVPTRRGDAASSSSSLPVPAASPRADVAKSKTRRKGTAASAARAPVKPVAAPREATAAPLAAAAAAAPSVAKAAAPVSSGNMAEPLLGPWGALPGVGEWMQLWQGMAQEMTQAPAAPAMPNVTVEPNRLIELQRDYMQQLTKLWGDFVEHPEKTTAPIKDSRFSDPSWQQNSVASFYARAYLLNADFLNRMADSVKADRKTKGRVKFAVSQLVDAAAPSNYLALNPKAQKTLLESSGESLKQGLQNLLGDMQKGKITQTDEAAFEVGRNVATSEGAVVFENALIQLIQYKPLTSKVYARPFLMVPPSINKFYILDLQPENSMIRYAVELGHTVFVVSWKNPHEPESKMTWDDYLELGPIAAIHAIQDITGSADVNALGFCVGGTILASALAVMYARGEQPVASVTLMTALLDFEDTGVLDVFIDENQVRMREKALGQGGLMPGRELAMTFSSLRANDLVWNYVVSNYLEGKQPPAFDLLYWNGDSTNLPGPMYAWYLRNTYLENNLRVPNRVQCCGVPLDLSRIKVPTYVFAAREDHIVPWKAAYASARVMPGTDGKGKDVRYVLGASGHIAGSINPPSKNKRSYWTHGAFGKEGMLPADSETWLAGATEHPGSWWSDWGKWMAQFGGPQKSAPKDYGNAKHKVIEPAPGRYVKEKA